MRLVIYLYSNSPLGDYIKISSIFIRGLLEAIMGMGTHISVRCETPFSNIGGSRFYIKLASTFLNASKKKRPPL